VPGKGYNALTRNRRNQRQQCYFLHSVVRASGCI
jgi:hypothetical protein